MRSHRRIITPLLLTFLLAACADQGPVEPGPSFEQAPAAAMGPPDGFPVVFLGGAGGQVSASSLDEAVAKVRDGGTIRVSAGTWDATAVVIEKSVTIEGVSADKPVIRIAPPVPGAEHSGIEIYGAATRATFRHLIIDNQDAPNVIAIYANGAGHVAAEDVDFRLGGAYALFAIGTGAGESAAVEGGSVRGGLYGLIGRNVRLDVNGTSLAGHRWNGVYLFAQAQGTITGTDMAECGHIACVEVASGATATVTDNRLSNTSPPPPPSPGRPGEPVWYHHVVLVRSAASATVSGNTIDGCGAGQCVTVTDGATASLVSNQITVHGDQLTRFGIIVSHAVGDPSAGAFATIQGNTITGVGSNPGNIDGKAIGCGGWCGVIQLEGHTSAAISGNTLSNGTSGIISRVGADFTGRDNVVSNVHWGIRIEDGGNGTVHFSDVTDYAVGFSLHSSDPDASSATCNWWGQAPPPAARMHADPSLYTPFATASIANTGATGCE